ncbi:MAG TPA: arylsulfotransferase family protein, partial [Vicinamibacteria bacterium]
MRSRFGISLAIVSALASCSVETTVENDAEDAARKLQALPYTSWSPIEHADKMGVVVHDAALAQPGYNLFNSVTTTEASLLDMDGNRVHTWSRDTGRKWDHVELLPTGELLVLNENPRRFVRLDWDSNIVWTQDIDVHHDVDVTESGDIYVLSAAEEFIDYDGLEIPVRNHYIRILSSQGDVRRSISFLPLLQRRLDMPKLVEFIATGGEIDFGFLFEGDFVDVFHVNTLAIIDRTYNEFFQKGFVLFAARSLNLVGVVDVEKEALVWSWGQNYLDWPHQPVLLESGNLLIFDNGSHRDYSRIIELDPLAGEIVWEYKADPPDAFFSIMMGSVQALPNANILVTESTKGHVFELTRDGTIVWEFYNPDLNEVRDKRATIYRMNRIQLDFLEPGLLLPDP